MFSGSFEKRMPGDPPCPGLAANLIQNYSYTMRIPLKSLLANNVCWTVLEVSSMLHKNHALGGNADELKLKLKMISNKRSRNLG